MPLRTSYAMPSTDRTYGVRACPVLTRPMGLPAHALPMPGKCAYAMSGTEIVYGVPGQLMSGVGLSLCQLGQ
eukprot:3941447-Rhodomonas_salina.2